MEKNTIIDKARKQIEVYKNFIECLEMSKEIIQKFENKVFNIRLKKALNEGLKDKKDYSFNNGSYNNFFNENFIYIRIYSNDINFPVTDIHGKHWEYIEFNDCNIKIILKEKTNNRIDSELTLKEFEKAIKYLNECIKDLEKNIETYDTMINEYNDLKMKILEFNDKYNLSFRNDSYCKLKCY